MNEVGFPFFPKGNERRRALLPEDRRSVRQPGALVFELGYGAVPNWSDDAYVAEGAVVADRATACASPAICNPKPRVTDECFGRGTTRFG